MKLGINSYTCMWSIGFQGVNPAFPDRAACPTHPLSSLDLLQKARDLGVKLVQTGPNLPFPEEIWDEFKHRAWEWGIQLELGTRGLDVDHLTRQVGLAKRMGAALIRTLPELDGRYLSDAHLIPPAIRPILPLLERDGIRLALENGRIPAVDLRAALDELNSPHVGVVLDMVNSLAVPEGWKEVTRLLAPHTMCVHYKDFIIRRAWHMMGFMVEGAPAGNGMLDPEWLFEALRDSPYDFNVILELWPPEQDTLEATLALEQAWVEESIPYLRRLISD